MTIDTFGIIDMSKISPFVFAVAFVAIICVQSIDGVNVPTLHQQCVDLGFGGVCRSSFTKITTSKSPNRCSFQLTCGVRVGTVYFKQFGGFPQNGSPCGPDMICHNGRCIPAPPGLTYVGPNIDKICGKMVPSAYRITVKTTPKPEM